MRNIPGAIHAAITARAQYAEVLAKCTKKFLGALVQNGFTTNQAAMILTSGKHMIAFKNLEEARGFLKNDAAFEDLAALIRAQFDAYTKEDLPPNLALYLLVNPEMFSVPRPLDAYA